MKYGYLFALIFILACGTGSEQNQHGGSTTEIIQNEINNAKDLDMPGNQYSQRFYDQLTGQEDFKSAVIKDGYILLTDTDTTYFPEQPPFGESIRMEGKNDAVHIKLSFTRINYTSITYSASVFTKDKTACQIKGEADLSTYFFLGSESDTNELTGESYLSTEFTDAEDNCTKSLRIGQSGEGEKSKYLAKIILDCLDQCASVDLENCPILIEI